MSHLGVNCKVWLPTVRRDDFADAVFRRLWRNLLHILEGILEILFRWLVRRRFLKSKRPYLLCRLPTSHRLSSTFHTRQVERRRTHGTEVHRRWIRVIAITVDRRFPSRRHMIAI